MPSGGVSSGEVPPVGSGRRAPPSKITIPPLEDWVIARPRLSNRLSQATKGPLTVVSGPPGAGKTIALSSWATDECSHGPVAWLSWDSGDQVPAVFWRNVADALAGAGVAAPSSADGSVAFITDLVAQFAGRSSPAVLVLDDFQPEPGSPILDALAYLIRHARPGLRLVLVGRVDPPLALHRYRLTNELSEIRAPELAFSEQEAATLLAQHEVALRPATLEALCIRTEGWAAGLRLAAMSMEGLDDPDPFVAQFAGDDHAVASYLVEEALDSQPADLRRLLLATSVVERINAELALELADGGDEHSFARMVRRNSFVVPMGHGWYRYHHMLADALRLVLRHESPTEVSQLHRRAAAWFDLKGFLPEAIGQAVQAGDWHYACRLVVDRLVIGQVTGLVEGPTFAGLFESMPVAILRSNPEAEVALVAAANALARRDTAGCSGWLRHAEASLGSRSGDQTSAQLAAAVVALLLGLCQDVPPSTDLVTRAEDLLDRILSTSTEHHADLVALIEGARGRLELWAGRLDEAAASFKRGVGAAEQVGSHDQLRYALGNLALVEALRGRLGRAADLTTEAMHLPEPSGSAGLPPTAMQVARAWLDLEQCEIGEARIELGKARRARRDFPDACLSALSSILAARIEIAGGSPARALELLKTARSTAGSVPWLHRTMRLVEADAHIAAGSGHAAQEAAELAGGTAAADSSIALVRAKLCDGDVTEAAQLLRPSLSESAAVPTGVRVQALLLDAQLSQSSGDGSRARRSLDRALRLAEKERLRLPFAASKTWLGPMLRRDPELLQVHLRLLEPLHLGHAPVNGANGIVQDAQPVEPLTSRELDVLKRVALMMTSEEIAEELFLSVNTVKTHLKNIYRKLAVTRRFEAVRRAQRLQLL
jgi:LuxR family transcriptional regulator, maltose regulon positive regulatory protein